MSLWRSRPLFIRPRLSQRSCYHALTQFKETRKPSVQAETVDGGSLTMTTLQNEHDNTQDPITIEPYSPPSFAIPALHPRSPSISQVTSSHPIPIPSSTISKFSTPTDGPSLPSRRTILEELEKVQSSAPTSTALSRLLTKWLDIIESQAEEHEESSKMLDREILFSFLRLSRAADQYHIRQTLWSHLPSFNRLQQLHDVLGNQWSCDEPGDSLVVEAAMGEIMVGVREWDTLLHSLRRYGMLEEHDLDEPTKRRFLSTVIKQWTPLQPWIALKLQRSARNSGVVVNADQLVPLFEQFVAEKRFTTALELLEEVGNGNVPGLPGLMERLMQGLADAGTVTLPDKMANHLGNVSSHAILSEKLQNPWLWDWCVQVLVGSRQYTAAVQVLEKIANSPGGLLQTSTIRKVTKRLCEARLFTLAEHLLNVLPRDHPSRTALLHTVFCSAARAGQALVIKRLWSRLTECSFTPTNHDRLLLLYGTRDEWIRTGISSNSILSLVSSDDKRSLHLAQQLLVLAGRHARANKLAHSSLAQHTIGVSDHESSPATFNALLSTTLMRQPHPQGSKLNRAQRVFTTFLEMIETHTPSKGTPFAPDLVTFNILVKAFISLDKVTLRTIRGLFDRLILAGYPSGEYPLLKDCNKGPVFGSDLAGSRDLLDFTRSSNTWLKECLSKESLRRSLSFEKHVEPLYKMFKKTFYRRGDKESARVVLYIYKSVKEQHALKMEATERKQLLKQREETV
ncbi:hypothetical protein FRC03_009317 [Tulasnella sp. 419]|nr:hypothetical protein FRC03_009317 [Tulasnella sp. 419]